MPTIWNLMSAGPDLTTKKKSAFQHFFSFINFHPCPLSGFMSLPVSRYWTAASSRQPESVVRKGNDGWEAEISRSERGVSC